VAEYLLQRSPSEREGRVTVKEQGHQARTGSIRTRERVLTDNKTTLKISARVPKEIKLTSPLKNATPGKGLLGKLKKPTGIQNGGIGSEKNLTGEKRNGESNVSRNLRGPCMLVPIVTTQNEKHSRPIHIYG